MKRLKSVFRALLALMVLTAVGLVVGFVLLKKGDIPYEQLEAKYADPASKFIDLSHGVRVHYHDQGKRDGHALLLIHGFGVNMTTWQVWLGALEQNYRLITIDLPGHGLTRAPASYQPSIVSFADLSAELAAKLGVEKYTVIGNSMGGHTAWMLALRHPDHVEGLVLVDAGGWLNLNPAEQPAVFRIINNPTVRPWLDGLDLKLFLKSGLKAAFEDKTRVSDAMIERYSDFALAPGHRPILGGILRSMNPDIAASKEKLAAIQVPTLILWGDKDAIIPVSNAKKFQDAIAGASVIIYPNVGHLPEEECPQKSVRDVQRFLATTFPPVVAALSE